MKPSGIGGMAVLEGVMMKNKDEYAIAVRKPNNEIVVDKKVHKDFSEKVKLFKLPIFRGMIAFVDSMVIGIKVLNYASSFFEEEEDAKAKKKKQKKNKMDDGVSEEISATKENTEQNGVLMMIAAVIISLALSIGLFMVLPVLISGLFTKIIDSVFVLSVVEAALRLAIFIGYIFAVSLMPDIKRVFMYHGAEHKTINCLENGFELTVENVKWQSKEHKRCGTSFMLFVMLISAVFFMILQPKTILLRVVSRILLVPIIAGLSYEFIRFAGKSNNPVIHILSKPGLWMQGLTTKEPDDSMIEVAIQSVEAVFDWRTFIATGDKAEEGAACNIKVKAKEVKDSKHKNRENKKALLEPEQVVPQEAVVNSAEEEDDDILQALDKYLDFDE